MRKELGALHPIIQFLLFLLAGLVSMAVMMVIIILAEILIKGNLSNLGSISGDIYSLLSVNVLKMLQIAQSVGLFMVPYFLYRWANKETVAYSYFGSSKTGKLALIFGIAMFAAYPFINLMAAWNSGLHLPEFLGDLEAWMRTAEAKAEVLIKQFLLMETPIDLIVNLLVIAVFPAISEELFFRGFMQNTLLKMLRNHHVAIWITAFVFSAIHMQFLGFFPRFLLGAMLGYAAMYSGTLIVPILGHFINNGLAVVLAYVYGMEMMDTPEGMNALNSADISYGLVSMVALAFGMWMMHKNQYRKA